ncbi:GDSL-type esterase/lipase family protein [Vibrio pelagius]|uniref:GDSL-type esterase/lipase family protein n=1 Tax=Vibrio pelagius TaxID=28169 RepID=UPI0021C30113|nr:GDSL-type esterase/lipase family protein [Vibrio pelagius]
MELTLDLDNAHCPVEKYLSSIELFQQVERKCDWVFLGDSITNAGRWAELFSSLTVSNQGIDGDTVKGMLGRAQLVSNTHAESVFILAGINDIIQQRSIESIMNHYQALVTQFLECGHQVIIQSTLYTSVAEWNQQVTKLNSALKQLAEHHKLLFIDINEGLGFHGAIDPSATYDGTHLQPTAYIKWQQTIARALQL